jgi:glycosyltransferase involved in cell wall biosynthesis
MPRRKVMFLIPTLLGGGSERVIVNLLRHLDRARFQCTLVVVDMHDAAYRADIPADVELVDLDYRRVRYAVPGIIQMIWLRRPDVVLSTLGHMNLALGLVRAILPWRTRFIARETIVVSELLRSKLLGRVLAFAYRVLYRSFDAVVCQSRDMRNDLVDNMRLPAGKIFLIHNPVDVERVRMLASAHEAADNAMREVTGPGVVSLVAAGRLVHQKGFDLLLDALAQLADPRLHLTLLGEGPLRSELERQVRALGLERQVRFAGFQPNPYSFFAHADALVLSSRYEGFPNVVLEALACGTPVVATPAPGGVREILANVAGCHLAERIDSESLAAALSRVVPGRRLPKDVASAYDARRIAARYENLLSACPGA